LFSLDTLSRQYLPPDFLRSLTSTYDARLEEIDQL
jgi:hypothetical protein